MSLSRGKTNGADFDLKLYEPEVSARANGDRHGFGNSPSLTLRVSSRNEHHWVGILRHRNSREYLLADRVYGCMQLIYRIAADGVVTLHLGYVLVVVLGLPITLIGILYKHAWARNFWWRSIHLAMILIVVMEAWAGITCPLTTWERELRELAQQQTYQGAFVANLIHDWLFIQAPPWAINLAHAAFGVLVLLTFIIAPPHWPSAGRAANPSPS